MLWAGVAALSLATGRSVAQGELDTAFLILASLGFTLLVVSDARLFARGERPIGVPVMLLGLPFFHLLSLDPQIDIGVQLAGVLLVVFYFGLSSVEERQASIARAKPLLLPVLLLLVVLGLSVIASEHVTREAVLDWINIATATGFLFMVCLYCTTLESVRRLVMVLIAGATLQFPVMVLQALGLTDRLPGGLAQLSTRLWGGPLLSTSSLARYPGSFGDVELVAEYLGLLFLLCIGAYALSGDTRTRRGAALASVPIALAGWLTGTRGFVFGVLAGGLLLLLLLLSSTQGGKRFGRLTSLLLLVSCILVAVAWLIPPAVSSGFMARVLDVQLTGPNAMSRGVLFSVWLSLLPAMPVFGYGANMLDTIRAAFPLYVVESPHSLYFTMLLTAGYLGLAAIVVLVLTPLVMSVWSLRKAVSPALRHWGIILVVVLSYWVVSEVKIEFVRLVFYTDYVFALFGLACSVFYFTRQELSGAGRS